MTDSPDLDRTATDKSASKSDSAFRTISEVATALDVPQHVLRFWESKFPQLKPLKRGGGRRYYRAEDVQFLTRVRDLLYVDGYTIKGVQKLLRQSGGVRAFVAEHDRADETVEASVREVEATLVPTAEPAASTAASADNGELRAVIADLKDLHARLLQAAG